jgi:GTP-binding protein
MFVDEVKIKIASGCGGNGIATWRQEKFVAHGGPDGGTGGRGGSVYLQASKTLNTLLDFKYKSIFKADDGSNGARNNRSGRSGEDLIVKVPCGTIVYDANLEQAIADLKEDGERVLIAKGGRGGRGNAMFQSNRNRAPYYAEPGEASIEREIRLELKMIADVGIIGFPNAGKSTLISCISAAKPKIADYAFTTIKPNLGVVKKENGEAFTVADIPGLIEGASEGHGLGHLFLKHIERTRLLVHVVDIFGYQGENVESFEQLWYQDPLKNIERINIELAKFSPKLAAKKQILAINKVEAYPDEELTELKAKFNELAAGDENILETFYISAATGEGLTELKRSITKHLDTIEDTEELVEVLDEDDSAVNRNESDFQIERVETAKEVSWVIHCMKLERQMRITNIREIESLKYLYRIAKAIGVFDELRELGAQHGDILVIDGAEFEVNAEVLL